MFPPLYAIVDEAVAAKSGWTVVDLARACLAGGARLLQVRAKRAGSAELLASCERIVAEGRACGATILVNDRPDVAALAGADGVHVGQDDLPVASVRRAFPGLRIVGLSTHTAAQLDEAVKQGPSYLAVGPIYGTTTKETGYDAVGLDLVRLARRAVDGRAGPAGAWPVVAIGGITLERAPAVLAAGATSVAVISDLLVTGDPERRVRAYLDRLT